VFWRPCKLRRSPPKPAVPEGTYYEYDDESAIKPGAIVLHPKFGRGRVVRVEGLGEDMRLDVDFASVGPKRLIAKYAHLTVVSG